MIVRFTYKEEQSNFGKDIFRMEDKSGNAKIVIDNGIVWVGMFCAIEAIYENGMYHLVRLLSFEEEKANKVDLRTVKVNLKNPLQAYRMLMIKGPFRAQDSSEDVGLMVLYDQVQRISKMKSGLDLIVIMGPFLSVRNAHVENCSLEKSFQEEF